MLSDTGRFGMMLAAAALFLAAGLPAAFGAGGNLLVNGGFEMDMVEGRVPGWTMDEAMAQQKVWLDEADAFQGRRSLAIRIVKNTDPDMRWGGRAVFSQQVQVEPDTRYVFTMHYKRDSFVHGAFVHIQLLDADGEEIPGALFRKGIRSRFWTSTQLSFHSADARYAEVRIVTNTGGTRRILVGRTLWLDEMSLVQLDATGNLQEVPASGRQVSGSVEYAAPTRLYPWVKLTARGPHDIALEMAGRTHTFRTYTHGRETWVQPILPDLVVPAGRHAVRMEADGGEVAFSKLLFTQDPTWQPDDAPDLRPAAQAAASRQEHVRRSVPRGEVPLTLQGDMPEGRWPVAQGVPFPEGDIMSVDSLQMARPGQGGAVPFQAEPLMLWGDGSIRWAAVAVQGGAGEEFVLRYGPPRRHERRQPPSPVQVGQDAEGVAVRTGPLQAFVPADGSGVLGRVSVNGRPVFESATLIVNGEYTSRGTAPEVKLEESGPMRAVVRVAGEHLNAAGEKLLDYVVRWHFHAGSARVDVEHTFLHREAEVEIRLDQVALVFALAGGGANRVALDADAGEADLAAGPVLLNSRLATAEDARRADYPFSVSQGGREIASGVQYPGGFALSGADWAVRSWTQDFWQNGPREMRFAPDSLAIGLVGDPGTPFYTGMAKTARLTLALDGDADAVAAYAAEPLLMAPAEWYSSTRAAGHRFFPRQEGRYAAYERCMDISMNRWIASTNASKFRIPGAGLLHYGDVVSGRGVGNNLESALDEGALIQFLRTGDRAVYDYARIAIDHFVDIDIDHSHINGGLIWVHRTHDRDVADAGRAGLNGHSWFNGVPYFEMFRASRRIHDVADRVGTYYAKHGFGLEPYVRPWRPLAWQLMCSVQAYKVTGKVEYLEAARQSVVVTRHQRDFFIEEWPYMFSVGMQGVRLYYQATRDPEVRELYLQLMDGFLRLRERPEDTVNGEWRKPEGTVLGNFPNDRSCAFYNEGAWAYWLSGDRRYVDTIASDLNWHAAMDVNDPTLLKGSADLVQAMSELGVGPPESAVEHPWAFMPPELVPLDNGGAPRAGAMAFRVHQEEDAEFLITLFKSATFKYMVDYNGFATVFSPSGRRVARIPVSNRGINQYRITVPADGETGYYTVDVEFENLWQWTMEEATAELRAGTNRLLLSPRHGHISVDAVAVAPVGRFPWVEEDAAHVMAFPVDADALPDGWVRFEHGGALGGAYARRATGREPLAVEVQVPQAGQYRLFLRVWKPFADVVATEVEGTGQTFNLGQIHDMAGRAYPMWSLASSLGPDSVVRYWQDLLRENPPMAHYTTLFMEAPQLASWLEDWEVSADDPAHVSLAAALDKPIDAEGNYLKVAHYPASRGLNIGRSYLGKEGLDVSKPHSVRFRWRVDDAEAFFASEINWVRICGSSRLGRFGGDARWWVGAIPRTRGGTFTAWRGDRQGQTDGSVNTGIRLQEGTTYSFRIDVFPESRSAVLTLDDGETTFTSPELPWRTASADAGGFVTINTQLNEDVGKPFAYSLLEFEVVPLEE